MRIYAIKTSPDDQSVETTLVRNLKPHASPVVVLAVDRTSSLVATGAADGNVKVWDVSGGFVTHSFRGPSVLVSALRFFEVAAEDVTYEELGLRRKKKSRKGSSAQDASQDANSTTANFRLAAGSQDGKVRVWDLHKRTAIADLDSHVSDVQALDYSPTERALLSASRDKTIIWWDARSWQIRRIVPSLEAIEVAGFLADGRLVFSGGAKGCVRIWESDTGREVTKEQVAKSEEEAIVGAVYNAERAMLLCVQMDHAMLVYRTPPVEPSAAPLEMDPLQPLRRISGTHDDIIDLAYLLPDQSLFALATNSESIRIVSAADGSGGNGEDAVGRRYFGQDLALLKGHDDIIITLDVDWSGHWVATGAKDNTARLWRVDPAGDHYACYATFSGHANSLGAVALPKTPPQDTSAAYKQPLEHPPPFLITGSQDQTVKRWEIPRIGQEAPKKGPKAVYTRKAHEKDINALDVNASSQLFASASQDRTVKIWSVQEGEVQGILKGHKRGVWCVRFAPADTPIIQGEGGPVAGRGVVLTGSGDKTIKLWNLSDYTCLRTFEGHSNSILKVAWLNRPAEGDKQRRAIQFASAGGDGLVKVWDAAAGEAECTLDNHADRVWALTVNPRTNAIVSGSADSTLTVWRDTSSATQAAAQHAALQLVEQEQAFDNHVRAGAYREAITIALQLNHPGRLLALFTAVVAAPDPDPNSLSGRAAVDDVVASLSDEQLFTLLLRLRDWNANARSAPVAQRILGVVVRSYSAERLSGLRSVKGQKGQRSLVEVLDALRAYTERHYRRMEELVDESYLVEYTLREMDALAPAEGLDGTRDVVMTS